MADTLARARTATLLGSVLTALSSGTNYVYSGEEAAALNNRCRRFNSEDRLLLAYAPQLGSRLHITYTHLNVIALSGNMGVSAGPFLGRIGDKHGPRPLLILAFILLFAGYTGIRSYYDAGPRSDQELPLSSLVALSLFSYMTGAGGYSGVIAAINTTAKSFPEHMRATTVGLVLSGFGLSAFLFSTLAQWFFPGDTSSFLLFLALGTSLPVIVGFLTVRPIPHAERPDVGSCGSSMLAELDANHNSNDLLRHSLAGSVNGMHRGDDDVGVDEDAHELPATGMQPEPASPVDGYQSTRASIELSPTRGNIVDSASSQRLVSRVMPFALTEPVDTHGKRMLMGWEFWLLFTILSLLSGTGLMFINNVGSIAQAIFAKGNPDFDRLEAAKIQAAQVSTISLANCAARLGVGAGADFAKSRFSVHRSYFLLVISTLFIISQIVGSRVENVNHLWQASVLLGLGYGGVFGLLPTITIEWFGLTHFSENWGFVGVAPLLGGNLFGILFGTNLDAHVPASANSTLTSSFDGVSLPMADLRPRTPIPLSGRQCLEGRVCYAGTLHITTLACMVALVLSLMAAWRDQRKDRAENKYESVPEVSQEAVWEDDG